MPEINRLSAASSLSAYEIHLKVHPTMPVGSFAVKLNITTDIMGKKGEPRGGENLLRETAVSFLSL